jgi:hypothetical protein
VPLIAAAQRMTENAPEQMRLLASAEYERKTWWVVPFGVVCICVALILAVVYVLRRPQDIKEKEVVTPAGLKPIPMNPTSDNPLTTIRAEVPCEKWRMLLLADGLIDNKKTLAFNQWTGTPVYKTLKNVREYLSAHELAYELNGKGGEMELYAEGVEFMQYIHDVRELPAPHVCIDRLPSPSVEDAQ